MKVRRPPQTMPVAVGKISCGNCRKKNGVVGYHSTTDEVRQCYSDSGRFGQGYLEDKHGSSPVQARAAKLRALSVAEAVMARDEAAKPAPRPLNLPIQPMERKNRFDGTARCGECDRTSRAGSAGAQVIMHHPNCSQHSQRISVCDGRDPAYPGQKCREAKGHPGSCRFVEKSAPLPKGYFSFMSDPILHRDESERRRYFVRLTVRKRRWGGGEYASLQYRSGEHWRHVPDHLIAQIRLAIREYGLAKSMMEYGKTHKRCGRCGKNLTDPESRKFGIGPDCRRYFNKYREFIGGSNSKGEQVKWY